MNDKYTGQHAGAEQLKDFFADILALQETQQVEIVDLNEESVDIEEMDLEEFKAKCKKLGYKVKVKRYSEFSSATVINNKTGNEVGSISGSGASITKGLMDDDNIEYYRMANKIKVVDGMRRVTIPKNSMLKESIGFFKEEETKELEEARKVTTGIVAAFLKGEKKKISNDHTDGNAMYLHGNKIAEKRDGKIWITNAGYMTNTTKERLNGIPNVSINQKAGQWYLNGKPWDGEWIEVGSSEINEENLDESVVRDYSKMSKADMDALAAHRRERAKTSNEKPKRLVKEEELNEAIKDPDGLYDNEDYMFFVCAGDTLVSGWEYKEDAQDDARENKNAYKDKGKIRICARRTVKSELKESVGVPLRNALKMLLAAGLEEDDLKDAAKELDNNSGVVVMDKVRKVAKKYGLTLGSDMFKEEVEELDEGRKWIQTYYMSNGKYVQMLGSDGSTVYRTPNDINVHVNTLMRLKKVKPSLFDNDVLVKLDGKNKFMVDLNTGDKKPVPSSIKVDDNEVKFSPSYYQFESISLQEKSPPSEKSKKWLEDPKVQAAFKDQYGDKYKEVMFAKAWKDFKEEVEPEFDVDALLESLDESLTASPEDWTPDVEYVPKGRFTLVIWKNKVKSEWYGYSYITKTGTIVTSTSAKSKPEIVLTLRKANADYTPEMVREEIEEKFAWFSSKPKEPEAPEESEVENWTPSLASVSFGKYTFTLWKHKNKAEWYGLAMNRRTGELVKTTETGNSQAEIIKLLKVMVSNQAEPAPEM